ncbi:MAG: mfd [Mycobacterium sp.]|nr:mfd [Mycobacterium sp.]
MTPSLSHLLPVLGSDPVVGQLVDAARGRAAGGDVTAPTGVRPFLVAALAGEGAPVLAVTATAREAEDLVAALGSVLDPETVAEFPAWETLPHERLSPRADTVGRRMGVLRRLAHPEATGQPPLAVIVAPVRSVLQPQLARLGDLEPVTLAKGDTVELDVVVERLVSIAYARVDMVDKRGEFAVRGGILDVFPPTEDHPIRVELWGDEVDDLRYFSVADQRTFTDPSGEAAAPERGLLAPPCRELLLTPDVRQRAKTLGQAHPELLDILDKLADGTPVDGMEAFTSVLAGEMKLLVEELPEGAQVVVCDPEKVRLRAAELVRTSEEFLQASWATAALGGEAPVDLRRQVGAAAFHDLVDVRQRARDRGLPWWSVTPFSLDADTTDDETTVVPARPAPTFHNDIAAATELIGQRLRDGWRVIVTTAGSGPAQRLHEVLREADLGARFTEALEDLPERVATVTTSGLTAGFEFESTGAAGRLLLITETDLAGHRGVTSTREMRRMPARRRTAIDPLQLRPGDIVVHESHGVGKYLEMVQRTVAGATREYLLLEYAPSKKGQPGDRLFVPTDQLDLVSRYSGGELPSLDRIGGSDWVKRKGRAKKAVKEIAGELIRLYSARQASPGYAFGQDTPWQRELEDAFPFNETADQLAAINEVKADMEKPIPMDRLICGDVGYGKTEIAVRAAFKAVQDGKQVAVLVPTTLLVQQHGQTFADRFAAFPVKVGQLSRFSSAKEQADVLAGLAAGEIDVVIGTHRLLNPSVHFKDLGLVIIDEEQRFGVEHKEALKHLRTAVDVLAMSATPIPRTLEMAVTGIRELSTIDTPPEERHPVLTFVGAYDEKQVTAALRRELLREGQVFYIHNRVESIDRAAARLRELVPEARIVTAHGQMGEDALEEVMVGFWERRIDVLVCTTIVESGLDVSNANTLLVERADAFGLSQLHQLRGRVGRGRERAYAYFLFPQEKPLTELAHDRLATIAQNTDLGAGMAIAMKDLEIRGAGNLLGGEQSGHIASVGFDLYLRLVSDAVAEFKGDGAGGDEVAEMKVELPVDAHLPHDYIPGERMRLDAYRRLAGVTDDAQLDGMREELRDRYGPLPEPVESLLAVAAFRVRARRFGVVEVALVGNQVRFTGPELRESQQLRLKRLFKGAAYKPTPRQMLVPRPTETGRMGSPPLRGVGLLAWADALIVAVLGDGQPAAAPPAATSPAAAGARR